MEDRMDIFRIEIKKILFEMLTCIKNNECSEKEYSDIIDMINYL